MDKCRRPRGSRKIWLWSLTLYKEQNGLLGVRGYRSCTHLVAQRYAKTFLFGTPQPTTTPAAAPKISISAPSGCTAAPRIFISTPDISSTDFALMRYYVMIFEDFYFDMFYFSDIMKFYRQYALQREVNWPSLDTTSSLLTELWLHKLSNMTSTLDDVISQTWMSTFLWNFLTLL